MPNLRDLIRHWVENPDAPSLYVRPEREVLAEMVAEAVANTSYSPWEEYPSPEPPVDGIAHGFTPFTAEEIAARDANALPSWVSEHYSTYIGQNTAPRTQQYDSLQHGEPIANTTCARCLAPDRQCVLRITAESSRQMSDTREMVCLQCLGVGGHNSYIDLASIRTDASAPTTATGAMIEDANRGLARDAHGELRINAMMPAITRMPCGCMQATCERCGQWLREYERPSHYRLTVSRCSCGFSTTVPSYMDAHLAYPNAELPPGMFDPSPILQGSEHRRIPGGGACACGFTSMFSTTLDNHLQVANQPEGCMGPVLPEFSTAIHEVSSSDMPSGWENAPVVDLTDGIPRRWFACSRCNSYGPCREYRVATYNYIANFGAEPQLPPNGPEFRTEYRCDSCVGERSGPTPPDADPSPDSG